MSRKFSVGLTAVAVLILISLPNTAMAARHWFTDENRTLKTKLFEASASKNSFCDPEKRDSDLFIYLRFAPDIDFEIGNNPEYLRIVESEIAPAVRDVCGEVVDLVVLNFFAETFRNSKGNEVPVSRAVFRNLLVDAYPARVNWVWFDAIFSGEFPPQGAQSFGNSSLTTPEAIHAWLSTGSTQQLVESFQAHSDMHEKSQTAPQEGTESSLKAENAQVDRKICAKQSRSASVTGGPSPQDVCRALERHLVERMTSANAVTAQLLHRLITGESSMIESGIYLESFQVRSCSKISQTSDRFFCNTIYRLGSEGKANAWFELFGKGQSLDRTFTLARDNESWRVMEVH